MTGFSALEERPGNLWHCDPRDKDPASELDRVGRFRSRMRMLAPAAKVVAIPNAAARGQRALNQARREGAAWGFPDLMVLHGGRVAYLEFKDGDGRPDSRQCDWLDTLHAMGFPCGVFRRADSAIDWLRGVFPAAFMGGGL